MYNRYIPEDSTYTWAEPEPQPPLGGGEAGRRSGLHFLDFLKGKDGPSLLDSGREGLSGLLKTLHLENLDMGDVLLMLIVLYLLVEGDDMELVIALGLVLLMGLGD